MATPFDNKKLNLTTKTLPGGGFPPSLKADMYKGNPSLFVLTGNRKGDGGTTFVRAGLEHKTAGLICQLIETMANKIINHYETDSTPMNPDESTIVTIECKSGKERETVSKVVVGRLKDDKMFISVISVKDSNAPVIQFTFGTDLFHPISVSQGGEKLNACISAMAAKEWAQRTRTYWYTYSIINPEEDTQGGGNSGGYNNNRGGNGGGNWNNNQGGGSQGGWDSGAGNDMPWES